MLFAGRREQNGTESRHLRRMRRRFLERRTAAGEVLPVGGHYRSYPAGYIRAAARGVLPRVGWKGKIFFPLLARREYTSVLLPFVERLSNETNDQNIDNVTLEIVLADFPYSPKLCQTNRENFLPPVSICLPAKDVPRKFIPEQILYIETNGRNVLIHEEKAITEVFLTITAIKEKLKSNQLFVQPHMSYLVNLAWVERVEGYDIILKNGGHVPLSQKRSPKFRKTFRQYLSSLQNCKLCQKHFLLRLVYCNNWLKLLYITRGKES